MNIKRMIYKFISCIIVLIILSMSLNGYKNVSVAALSGSVSVKSNKNMVRIGENFKIILSGQCESGINGIETTLEYDSSKIELVSKKIYNDSEDWGVFFEEEKGTDGDVTKRANLTFYTNSSTAINNADIYELEFKVNTAVTNGTEIAVNFKDTTLYAFNEDAELFINNKVCNVTAYKTSLTSSKYTVANSKISKISPKTTISDLKKNINITAASYVIYDSNGKDVKDTDYAKTGMKIILDGDTIYTFSVVGDVNSDGISDTKDMLKINKHRLGKEDLQGVYLEAGDVTGDGKVDTKDMLKINKVRLGKESL